MKTFILPLLLVPGLGLFFTFWAIYFFKAKPKVAFRFLLLALVFGWLLSTTAAGRILGVVLISQIDGRKYYAEENVDLIIVPTGGMYYAGEVGWLPSQSTYRRLAVAYELQEQVGVRTPILISGGKTQGVRHPSEAAVAHAYFDRHRAEITPVLTEESSSNTYENVLQTVAVIQSRKANNVMLVTSELHMLRTLALYRSRGIDPIPMPAISLPRGPLAMEDFMPSWQGARLTSRTLYEVYAIAMGVIMGNINTKDLFYKK